MREIKFRAWDTIGKKYHYDVQDVYDEEIGDSFQDILYNENLIVEQDTGIGDINNYPIYEGDIVDTHWGNEPNRVVKYDNKLGFYLTPDQEQSYWTVVYDKLEVIGNIHDQPEFLEDK